IGFHDVDYHDGDGPGNVNYDGTDWPATLGGAEITWATQTYDQNQSANALRWGTLYNFRFDADAVPVSAAATITLFKPGTPAAVTTDAIPVPGNRTGDLDGDGNVDLNDLALFLTYFGTSHDASPAQGDADGDGDVDVFDLALLLSRFGTSCNP